MDCALRFPIMTNRPGPLGQQLAAEIRAELARQNKSRRWLAEQIDQPHATVARWISGQSSPGVDYMDDMCRALGFTVTDLLAAVQRKEHGGPERRRSTDRFLVAV